MNDEILKIRNSSSYNYLKELLLIFLKIYCI